MTDESAEAREPGSPTREQRRGRRIAMDKAEPDAFLTERRTCRVATVSPHGPDAGEECTELRGAALLGSVEIVGEVPRTGLPEPRLRQAPKAAS